MIVDIMFRNSPPEQYPHVRRFERKGREYRVHFYDKLDGTMPPPLIISVAIVAHISITND